MLTDQVYSYMELKNKFIETCVNEKSIEHLLTEFIMDYHIRPNPVMALAT